MARRGQRQIGRSPYRSAQPATRPRPRQRGHHPGARPRRARGRGRRPARAGDAVGAHEVPGRRAAGARGARPGQGRRDQHRGPPRRAAQAPRRDRDDPGEDRRPRHLAARAARRGRRRLRRGQVAQARHADGRRRRGAPEEVAPTEPAAASAHHRAPGRAAVGRLATAGQPVPRPRLLRRRQSAGPPAPPGQLGAARPAVQLVRARRQRSLGVHGPARAVVPAGAGWPGADAAPGAGGRRCRGRPPHLPARRRARPGQDRPGAARRAGRERLPAARRRAERRQDQLGARGRALDAEPPGHGDPRRRRHDRRLRRHRHRQLRGARPARRLARRPRLPRHGRRRGALHQEQVVPALAARAASSPSASGPASRGRC